MNKRSRPKNSGKEQDQQSLFVRFAKLYVNGPEGIKGNIAAATEAVGLKVKPNLNDPGMRQLIEAEGGTVSGTPSVASLLDEAATSEPKTTEDWCKLANKLQPVFMDIAVGLVKASAAQASVMKEIVARCHGKIGEKKDDDGERNVVILPTIGTGSTMLICPKCLSEFKAESNVIDDKNTHPIQA